MAGSYGPCRLGKYAIEQIRSSERPRLRSADPHHRLQQRLPRPGPGAGFSSGWPGRASWPSTTWRSSSGAPALREEQPGAPTGCSTSICHNLTELIRKTGTYGDLLRQATADFKEHHRPGLPRQPAGRHQRRDLPALQRVLRTTTWCGRAKRRARSGRLADGRMDQVHLLPQPGGRRQEPEYAQAPL